MHQRSTIFTNQQPSSGRLRWLKERFKRLQYGRGRWVVAMVATIQQTLLHRSPVLITVDRDGDWHNKRRGFTLVAPELNVTSYESAKDLVEDRWCYDDQLRVGDVVVDVGAGIGDDAVVFARMVGPTGHVIAIEAHPTTYRCLTKTIKANRLTNVTTLNVAVSAHDGFVTISDQANYLSNSIIDGESGTRVAARRLDDVCADLGIVTPRMVKMNIEGAETAAMLGASRLMARKIRFVVSCHDFKAERGEGEFFRTSGNIRAALESAGYQVMQRLDDPRREVYWILYADKSSGVARATK